MPSQRLLEILDPWGHVGPRRVLASATPTADLQRLYAVRWNGSSASAASARSSMLLSLEAVVAPGAPGLRELVTQSQLRVAGTQ